MILQGIRIYVSPFNEILAIILSICAVITFSYAFMFVFYSLIVVPFIIGTIISVLADFGDKAIFLWWI